MSLVGRDGGCLSTTYLVADDYAVGVDSLSHASSCGLRSRYKLQSDNGKTFASTTTSCFGTTSLASTLIPLPLLHSILFTAAYSSHSSYSYSYSSYSCSYSYSPYSSATSLPLPGTPGQAVVRWRQFQSIQSMLTAIFKVVMRT
jgi:hypothetical protein